MGGVVLGRHRGSHTSRSGQEPHTPGGTEVASGDLGTLRRHHAMGARDIAGRLPTVGATVRVRMCPVVGLLGAIGVWSLLRDAPAIPALVGLRLAQVCCSVSLGTFLRHHGMVASH